MTPEADADVRTLLTVDGAGRAAKREALDRLLRAAAQPAVERVIALAKEHLFVGYHKHKCEEEMWVAGWKEFEAALRE